MNCAAQRRRALAAAAALSLAAAGPAFAQSAQPAWPTQPVKVIVAGGAGSPTDITARTIFEPIGKKLGQPFVIDNRAGANGMLATEAAMHAPKDGYTLLFTYAAAQVVNQSVYPKVPYDGDRDFAPIAQVGAGGNLLIVPAALPVRDLKEFIAWVRTRPPGEVTYGSWGVGSGGHLSMEALIQQTGVQMRHVPYKTTPLMVTDLVGGHVNVGFANYVAAQPLIQSGKVRALAYSAPARTRLMPDVPTMTEQGVPFELMAWYGVFAPAGTPASIVQQLNREINALLQAPEMVKKLEAAGLTDVPIKTPEQFGETVRRDIREWGDVARKGNIRAE